eukprot:6490849-Amphidinium_carterae.2
MADLSSGPLRVSTARKACCAGVVEACCARNWMCVARRCEAQAAILGRQCGHAPLQGGDGGLLRELRKSACLGTVNTLQVWRKCCQWVRTHEVHELCGGIAAESL